MGFRGFPDGSADKQSTCNAGDTGDVGSSLGLERAAGEGNGNPLQYACQENSMDRGAWRAIVCGGRTTERLDTHTHSKKP